MEYVKINSLWKRLGWYFDEGQKKSPDYQKGRQSFIIGDYAEEAFGNIKNWLVDEKIDGTNIRIIYSKGKVTFGGRTEKAQIPCHLLEYLQDTFKEEQFARAFASEENPHPEVILFGEGYGANIQAGGGNYREHPGFILFDIYANGCWLSRQVVRIIADGNFGIAVVPEIGLMTEEQIIRFVKSKPLEMQSTSSSHGRSCVQSSSFGAF